MARLTSLQDIASSRKQISNYIITDKPSLIDSQDGTGNIVIYINDGDGAHESEKSGDKYTDLYIGDEHIAGGYGLKNIDDRNAVYQMMQDVDDIKKTLEDLENQESSANINNKTQFSINPNYHTIKTDDAVYTLDLNENTGVLTVYNNYKERVYNVVAYKTNNSVAPYDGFPNINTLSVTNSLQLSCIEFDYLGNEEIDNIAISIIVDNATDGNSNYINIGDSNGYSANRENSYFIPSNVYTLKDPDLLPNVIQQHWKLELTSSFISQINNYAKTFCDMTIMVRLITRNMTRKMTISAVKFNFVPPVFYYNSIETEHIPTILSTTQNMASTILYNNQTVLSFEQNNANNVYPQVFIPTILLGSKKPTFTFQSSGVKMEWKSKAAEMTNIIVGIQTKYAWYVAPYPYATTEITNWILQFE